MDFMKIVQIVPAPPDMWAWYKDETADYIFPNRVVCMALVEDPHGRRSIRPMALGPKDIEAYVVDDVGFVGFSFVHRGEDCPDE